MTDLRQAAQDVIAQSRHHNPDAMYQKIKALEAALDAPQRQPLSLDQISMIFNRVYPAQPLSQNVINLVQEVEKHHEIR